ncbi:MAG: response regulator transcription factor [Bacteroidetes bacterium]|nr:MAG: response regulator transcription factor [Bacteroidota bacterium]
MYNLALVEDDPIVRKILRHQLAELFPDIKILFESERVESTLQQIEVQSPDILIIDVNLIDGKGFDILHHFQDKQFEVIITTSSKEYAFDAIKYGAQDYLLKPVMPQALRKAIDKCIQNLVLKQSHEIQSHSGERIKIRVGNQFRLINPLEILYCEADGANTQITTVNEVVFASETMSKIEQKLENHSTFFRVHHSFIVNSNWIQSYTKKRGGDILMQNDTSIPISQRRLKSFELFLSSQQKDV